MSIQGSDDDDDNELDDATLLAQERTQLAIFRTRIAAERTLLAWIRTALAFFGFGFTIYGFFNYLANGQAVANRVGAPIIGIVLIAVGVAAMLAALAQHVAFLYELGVPRRQVFRSLGFIFGLVMIVIGLALFFIILVQASV